MIVDARVARRPGQRFSDAIRIVSKRRRVPKSLRKTEVDAVHQRRVARRVAHDEVRRLDVSMDQVSVVEGFDSFQELVCQLQSRLERKSAAARRKELLQAGAEKLEHHHVEFVVRAVVGALADSKASLQLPVHLVFVSQLRTTQPVFLEFHGHLGTSVDIYANVNLAERPAPEALVGSKTLSYHLMTPRRSFGHLHSRIRSLVDALRERIYLSQGSRLPPRRWSISNFGKNGGSGGGEEAPRVYFVSENSMLPFLSRDNPDPLRGHP